MNKSWHKPKTILQLASQINEVSTLVLNELIDFEKARVYSALVRGLTQSCSIEANRYRFAKERPQIEFEDN